MRIKFSAFYILCFFLLVIVMLEFHEMSHIITGRIICGCWGTRDFNVWNLCESCSAGHPGYWIATLAGPLFSFVMMWAGMYLLRHPGTALLGFSLVFANIPFGRLSQAMLGSGDEIIVATHFLKGHFPRTDIILVTSAMILLIVAFPVMTAFRQLKNKYSWLWLILFLTLPLVLILLYVLTFLNHALLTGFLSQTGIMGTPLFISIHTAVALILLLIFSGKAGFTRRRVL